MSLPQDPHRPIFHFGNPFRMILPKGSSLSTKHLSLLNDFEEKLAGRIQKLKPANKEDVLQISWMRCAMEQLCGIHTDVKTLIGDLELPVSDWKDKWIELYFDDSVKLLDISNAFISQIHKLEQSHLYLVCALHQLGKTTPESFISACSYLDKWSQNVASKTPSLDRCFSVMDGFYQTLDLPKTNNSGKEKVLKRAMYGVKVVTLFVCSVFAASFSGSVGKLTDLQVHNTYMWAESFVDLQAFVNNEIRSIFSSDKAMALKELEAIDAGVKKLYPIVRDGVDPVEAEVLVNLTSDLRKSAEEYSQGLVLLSKEVDGFFNVLLSGRDALTGKLRVAFNPVKPNKSVGSQLVK